MRSKQRRRKLASNSRRKDNRPHSLPSKVTRQVIRSHHLLQKRISQGLGPELNEANLAEVAEKNLDLYQQASLQGQSKIRGGDSSNVLVKWLQSRVEQDHHYRLLEIGSLQVDNACSRSKLFDVTRIDLKSQDPLIQEQDFMQRPIPSEDSSDRFDVISLSLVLNFVPDPKGRGDMLRRLCLFFHKPDNELDLEHFPCLFLVLPAACVTNSRYLSESRLKDIMRVLGYIQTDRKLSNKLIYYLFHFSGPHEPTARPFKKEQINPGKSRNNFAIVLD